MNAEQWINVGSAVVYLALAFAAAIRSVRINIARSMAVTCVALFAYTVLEVAGNLSHRVEFEWLENAAASVIPAHTFWLTLAFTGLRKKHSLARNLCRTYFGLLALSCLLPFVLPQARTYPGGTLWAVLMLVGLVPTAFVATRALLETYAAASGLDRARVQLFFLAVGFAVMGGISDLLVQAGIGTFRFAAIGLACSALIFAALTLRYSLLEEIEVVALANLFGLGLLFVAINLLVFAVAATNRAVFVFLTFFVTLMALSVGRPIFRQLVEERTRNDYLKTMGRFSAQMAHDMKNPLAAIRSAAQFLESDLKKQASEEGDGMVRVKKARYEQFLGLMLEQSDRMQTIASLYQRMGSLHATRTTANLEQAIQSIAQAQQIASPQISIEIRFEGTQEHAVDLELWTSAVENLVRNAREAPDVKNVWIEFREHTDGQKLEVSVRDNGVGIPREVLEQIQDDFFTTKATGSGLGLPFARRVIEAHEGKLHVESVLGQGTTVRLTWPKVG